MQCTRVCDDLSTCNDTEDGKWDEIFMSQLGQQTEDSEEMQESETEVDVQTEYIELRHVPETKITTFKDAITALEDVQNFLESRGHISTSMTYIGPAVDAVTSLQIASMSCTGNLA